MTARGCDIAVLVFFLLLIETVFSIVTVHSAAAQLADTPWPMFQHDLQHTGRSPFAGPLTPHLKWTYKAVNWIKSQPTIGADGTVYVATGFRPLCALDPASGAEKWCTSGGGDANSSSPAVSSDGTVYFGARDNKLWAVAPDGTVKWQYKVPFDGDVVTSPALAPDGTIYMACRCERSALRPPLVFGLVHAFTPDGMLQWQQPIGTGLLNSSPAVAADGTIYLGTVEGTLHALAPNSAILWQRTVGTSLRNASPVIGAEGTIYIGSNTGLSAITAGGTVLWTFATQGRVDTTPALAEDGTLYVSTHEKRTRTLYALTPSGSLLWSYRNTGGKPTNFSQSPSPVIDKDGRIYVGLGKGVYVFLPDGTLLWSYAIRLDVISLSLGNGALYVSARDAKLYAFGAQ